MGGRGCILVAVAQPGGKRILGLVVVLLIGAGAAVLAWRLTSGGDEASTTPAAEQPPDAAPVDPDIKRTGEGTYTIERAAWEEWMKSPSQMVTGVKAVAAMKDDIQQGFALQEIKPGSIAARLGLRSGDIVTHMNEVPLSSLVGVMRTVATLRTAAQVIIRFQRGGQGVIHTYGIVPPPPPLDAAPPQDAATASD